MNRSALSVLLLMIGGIALAQGKVATIDTVDGPDSRAEPDRSPAQTVIPEYPRQAWLEQIEGDVQVCFFVTRGGRPYNIAIQNSDHKVFERPAREAVKLSWFDAVPRSEKVPQFRICRIFQFRLESLAADEVMGGSSDLT